MWAYIQNKIEPDIQEWLGTQDPLTFEVPDRLEHGHLSVPVFKMSKLKKMPPPALAKALADHLLSQNFDFVEKVVSVSGFVNFFFTPEFLQQVLLDKGFDPKSFSSSKPKEASKKILIDFSSPNVAKPMHVGHLRATVIGQAICNLAKFLGHEVVGLNHIGDWGVQFGRVALAYEMWGHEYDFEKDAFGSLYALYVRIHQESKDNKELSEKGSLYFKRLEEGDPKLQKLWTYFVDISLKSYDEIYKKLGVHHDLVRGESFYNDRLPKVINALKEKHLLKEDQGAHIVDVGDKLPPCLILKGDGASLYATRDLASLFYRFQELKVDLNLYVTGADQLLHFKQVFEVAARLGMDWKSKSHHIHFGLYNFKDAKMSSREGNVVFLKDLISQAEQRVLDLMKDRNLDPQVQQKVASQVAVGAIVFNDLLGDRTQNVDFNWESVLNFQGNTGPYVQYTYVRCLRLLEKGGLDPGSPFDSQGAAPFKESTEALLVKHLLGFEKAVEGAFENYKPHILATYILELCQKFNHFYNTHRILDQPQDILKLRLALTHSVKEALEQGLHILGVPCPKVM